MASKTSSNGRQANGSRRRKLPKVATGIAGLDEVLDGGLPRGRPTLVCGNAGCGKTVLATQFLVNGVALGENGVLMTFDESAADIEANTSGLGIDTARLVARKKLVVDYVNVERNSLLESGEFDLDGLFIRLELAIGQVGAKRVVLDGIDNLFASFSNQLVLRSEIRRLLHWLKAKRLSSIITAERGINTLTRNGLEEYLADCVLTLDHKVDESLSTRRIRVVKYRGSTHGTNEYPFLIDQDGFSVLPVTSLGLQQEVSSRRMSTGIEGLDQMFGGRGYFEGSSILLSGTAGSGKTSVAAHFVDAACRRGERALFFAFEESVGQICRNMRSIGIDLRQWIDAGLLRFHNMRPTAHGLEMHLVSMHREFDQFRPRVVVVDPITSLVSAGGTAEVRSMLLRLLDALKVSNITVLATSLIGLEDRSERDMTVSSMMDAWLMVRVIETSGERNRLMHVLKARGVAHSNQVREFLISSKGVQLVPVYLGSGEVLTGSARLNQQAQERAATVAEAQEAQRRRDAVEHKRRELLERIATLEAEFASEEAEVQRLDRDYTTRQKSEVADRTAMRRSRQVGRPNNRVGGNAS